jgi:thiol:disulfide interchange protein
MEIATMSFGLGGTGVPNGTVGTGLLGWAKALDALAPTRHETDITTARNFPAIAHFLFVQIALAMAIARKMMRQLLSHLILLMATIVALPAAAQNNIPATLVAESVAPAAGQKTTLAVAFVPKPGWHGYWKNPGDAGFGTQLTWTLPAGVSAESAAFPVPERLVISGLMNHVYNGPHALLIPLTIPAGLPQGTRLPIRLAAEWLACTDKICVPEGGTLTTTLTIGAGEVSAESRKQFDGWRAALPRPLGTKAQYQLSGTSLTLAIPLPASVAATDAWFFAETENAVAYAKPQQPERQGDTLIIKTTAADSTFKGPIKGVLAIKGGLGLAVVAEPGVVPPGNAAGSAPGGWQVILLALAGSIAGGLLLNIMPCVFPVISLKALSLAKAGGDEGAARREALAYTAGAVAACLALGGSILALRGAGQSVGWAFQLQDARVILFLLLLVTGITANLAGLFAFKGFGGGEELAGAGGVRGSFWTGVLAAFVATPCTGPFMAAALGAALVLPTPAALAIFAGLGFGLALPFLMIGYVPALRARMPKPGAWMKTFQRWMAVPMALTAFGLLWLLWRQAGQSGFWVGLIAVGILIALVLLARKKWPFGVGLLLSLGVLAALTALSAPLLPKAGSVVQALPKDHVRFSESQLAALRKAGKPVFLYFTADWCLTCKVNEGAAIDRDATRAAFARKGITVMVGDWTQPDPLIARFLEARGRSGIPLYLYYPAGGGAPRELPQILTPAMLEGL